MPLVKEGANGRPESSAREWIDPGQTLAFQGWGYAGPLLSFFAKHAASELFFVGIEADRLPNHQAASGYFFCG